MQAGYAAQYRALWEGHWWWRSREAFVLRRAEALHAVAPLRRVLDVGCGDGLFFEALGRFGARVEGLEPDATLLTDGRWRERITVGALGPGFAPGPVYDLVLMLDVLEHIADDGGALRAAREALRPGGRLLLTVPALPLLWSRHDEVNEHHRRYRARGLRAALEGAGFAVDDLRYFFAWTVAPLLARRWLRPAGAEGRRWARDRPMRVPPRPLNAALTLLSRADHACALRWRWPLGSSLLALARVRGGEGR